MKPTKHNSPPVAHSPRARNSPELAQAHKDNAKLRAELIQVRSEIEAAVDAYAHRPSVASVLRAIVTRSVDRGAL